jgi:hypothetical protein
LYSQNFKVKNEFYLNLSKKLWRLWSVLFNNPIALLADGRAVADWQNDEDEVSLKIFQEKVLCLSLIRTDLSQSSSSAVRVIITQTRTFFCGRAILRMVIMNIFITVGHG